MTNKNMDHSILQTLGEVIGTQKAILQSLERIENNNSKTQEDLDTFKEKVETELTDIKIKQGKYGMIITIFAAGFSLAFQKALDFFAH